MGCFVWSSEFCGNKVMSLMNLGKWRARETEKEERFYRRLMLNGAATQGKEEITSFFCELNLGFAEYSDFMEGIHAEGCL